jgi:type I restriction enzyme S subunit
MSVPALRFKEFNSSWEVAKLGDLLGEKISNGEMIGKSDFVQDSGNFYLIQLNDLYESNIQLLVNKLQMVKFNEKAKSVEVGDTLINRVSIKPEGVGKVTVITVLPSNLRTIFESNMFRVRFASEKVYQLFFAYFSLTKSYEKQKLALSKTTNQSSLSQSDISFIEISYPKIPEQTKIANFLTAVDEKITQLSQKTNLLNLYKKGVMQKIFSQELRFKDDDGREFPDWDFVELEKVATKVNKKNKDLSISNVLTNSATQGIVSQSDYFDRDIANQNNLGGYYIVGTDDFVYNPRISANALVGPIKRNHLTIGVMSPLYTVFRFTKGNLNFYEQYFQTNHWHDYMKSISNTGARHDRMNITNESFFGLPLPCPVEKEQLKIANFLIAIDDKITQSQAELDAVKQYKQGLLQQMFV